MKPLLESLLDAPAGMRLVQGARILAAPREFVVRRRAARAVSARPFRGTRIDARDGYALVPPGSLPGLEPLLRDARRVLDRARPFLPAVLAAREPRRRVTVDLFSDDLLARERGFVDFVLQDEVLFPVVDYLGTVPYLARLALPLSTHRIDADDRVYHQRFHFDNDDFRQVKFFLNVDEVREEHGPLTFLPAAATARVVRELSRRGTRVTPRSRLEDEAVLAHCDPSELVRVAGPPGTGVLLDPSRCLHFGSRVAPGRERLVLTAVFLRWHRPRENASSWFDERLPGLDELRRLAIASPARRPRGYFCPDLFEGRPLAGVR